MINDKQIWVAEIMNSEGMVATIQFLADSKEEAVNLATKNIKKIKIDCNDFMLGNKNSFPLSTINFYMPIENLTVKIDDEFSSKSGITELSLPDLPEHITKEQWAELENNINKNVNKLVLDWIKKYNVYSDCFTIENKEIIKLNK